MAALVCLRCCKKNERRSFDRRLPWPPARIKSRALSQLAKTKLPRTIQKITNTMRLTLHHRYQRLNTKQGPEPAHENEAAAKPTTSRTSNGGTSNGGTSTTWTGNLVQEFGLTLDNPMDRALSAGHTVNRTENGNYSSWSMLPKRTVCYQQREWQ